MSDGMSEEELEALAVSLGKLRLRVGPKFMEGCGTNTVIGSLANKYGGTPISQMTELTLEMVTTTRGWREKNRGPNYWIMPEYSVQCFMENLLHLQQEGVKIIFEEFLEDPK